MPTSCRHADQAMYRKQAENRYHLFDLVQARR